MHRYFIDEDVCKILLQSHFYMLKLFKLPSQMKGTLIMMDDGRYLAGLSGAPQSAEVTRSAPRLRPVIRRVSSAEARSTTP